MGWERNPFGTQRELCVYRWTMSPMGRFLPRVVPRQQLPASAYAAGSLSRACDLGPAQSYVVGRFLLRRLHQGRSGRMLCGADSSLCLLHIPLQPPRAMPGRTSCLRYPRLWESWCRCCACGYLWWLGGWWHAVSLRAPQSPFLFAVVALYDLRHTASYFCHIVFADVWCSSSLPNQQSLPRPLPATTGTLRAPCSRSST